MKILLPLLIVSLISLCGGYAQKPQQGFIEGEQISPQMIKLMNDYLKASDTRLLSFKPNEYFDLCISDFLLNRNTVIYNDLFQVGKTPQLLSISKYANKFDDFGRKHPKSFINEFEYLIDSHLGANTIAVFRLQKENEILHDDKQAVEPSLDEIYYTYSNANGDARIIKATKNRYYFDRKNPLKKVWVPNITLQVNQPLKRSFTDTAGYNLQGRIEQSTQVELNFSFPITNNENNYLSLRGGLNYGSMEISSRFSLPTSFYQTIDVDQQSYTLITQVDNMIKDTVSFSRLSAPIGFGFSKNLFSAGWLNHKYGLPWYFELFADIVPQFIVQERKIGAESEGNVSAKGQYELADGLFIIDEAEQYGFGIKPFNEFITLSNSNLSSFNLNARLGAALFIPISKIASFSVGANYNLAIVSPFTAAETILEPQWSNGKFEGYRYNSPVGTIRKSDINYFSISAGVQVKLTDHFNNLNRSQLEINTKDKLYNNFSIIVNGIPFNLKVERKNDAQSQYRIGATGEWQNLAFNAGEDNKIVTNDFDELYFRRPFAYKVVINKGTGKSTYEYQLGANQFIDKTATIDFESRDEGKISMLKTTKVHIVIDNNKSKGVSYQIINPKREVIAKGQLKKEENQISIKIPDTKFLNQYEFSLSSGLGYKLVPESSIEQFSFDGDKTKCNLAFIAELSGDQLHFALEEMKTTELVLFVPNYTNYFTENNDINERDRYENNVLDKIKTLVEDLPAYGNATYFMALDREDNYQMYGLDLKRFKIDDYIREGNILPHYRDFIKEAEGKTDADLLNAAIRKVHLHVVFFDPVVYRKESRKFNLYDNYNSSAPTFLSGLYAYLYKNDYSMENFSLSIYLKADDQFNRKNYTKQLFEYPYTIHFF